jgi:hypothetical protein
MLLQTYFHDHKLTTTAVCTTRCNMCGENSTRPKFSAPPSPPIKTFIHTCLHYASILCAQNLGTWNAKNLQQWLCKEPWKLKFHPRHVFAWLTSSAGPVCLLNTLLYNSLLCNICLCLGPNMYSEWRHHDVLENQLVLHKRTSAQCLF